MTTRVTAPAEKCHDGSTWTGYWEPWENLGSNIDTCPYKVDCGGERYSAGAILLT